MFVFVALPSTTREANRTVLAITTLSRCQLTRDIVFNSRHKDHLKDEYVQATDGENAHDNKLLGS